MALALVPTAIAFKLGVPDDVSFWLALMTWSVTMFLPTLALCFAPLLGLYLDKSSSHPLGNGAEIRDVYLVDPGLAVIDTNDAFADGHRSGVLVEELTVASLVETLSANISGINRVKILVGGKERETLSGHADLSGFYDVSAVSQMVTGLQQ